jgi:hypothetical protein
LVIEPPNPRPVRTPGLQKTKKNQGKPNIPKATCLFPLAAGLFGFGFLSFVGPVSPPGEQLRLPIAAMVASLSNHGG